jgi:hypothetical protein
VFNPHESRRLGFSRGAAVATAGDTRLERELVDPMPRKRLPILWRLSIRPRLERDPARAGHGRDRAAAVPRLRYLRLLEEGERRNAWR